MPGFGFVVCRRQAIESIEGWARSLSLDLYDQWHEMETKGGKWRYTSPTHVVRAFAQALKELEAEGGVSARYARYRGNQQRLVQGMEAIGFQALIEPEHQSPFITSFLYPDDPGFTFDEFYAEMKQRRFVLYPGKVSTAETFRIGTIGNVFPEDVDLLLETIREVVQQKGWKLKG